MSPFVRISKHLTFPIIESEKQLLSWAMNLLLNLFKSVQLSLNDSHCILLFCSRLVTLDLCDSITPILCIFKWTLPLETLTIINFAAMTLSLHSTYAIATSKPHWFADLNCKTWWEVAYASPFRKGGGREETNFPCQSVIHDYWLMIETVYHLLT